jgi:hypothetical protein
MFTGAPVQQPLGRKDGATNYSVNFGEFVRFGERITHPCNDPCYPSPELTGYENILGTEHQWWPSQVVLIKDVDSR